MTAVKRTAKSTPPESWSYIREPARSILMALWADPADPLDDYTPRQLTHVRTLCQRATGRKPWTTHVMTDGRGSSRDGTERHLRVDAINTWAGLEFARHTATLARRRAARERRLA